MSDETPVLELDPDPLVGSVLADRYRISKRLGEGGMGSVYLARHTVLEKLVALKILHPEYSNRPELVQRFLHEAKAASRIRHENVIDVFDFGQLPNGNVFFAMELLDGRDLAIEIQTSGTIEWPRAKRIMLQICSALDAAHEVGVIHRDLKPENIYLMERIGNPDFVKILDFGIAKLTELSTTEGKRLTRTGMVFGTPEYMSPEQARGERPDKRVDVYAAGCILYEMTTGQVPFLGDNFMSTLTKHIFDAVPSLRERRNTEEIPVGLDEVIQKALRKDRDQRYASMKELAVAIAALDQSETIPPAVSTPPVAKANGKSVAPPARVSDARALRATHPSDELPAVPARSPRWVYAAIGVALAALAVVGFMLLGRSGDQKPTTPAVLPDESRPVSADESPTTPVTTTPVTTTPVTTTPVTTPPAADTAPSVGVPDTQPKNDRRRDPKTKPQDKPATTTPTTSSETPPVDPTPTDPTTKPTNDGNTIKTTRDLKDPFPKPK